MSTLRATAFFSKKVWIQKENVKENKTTQAQDLPLDCILSFFRVFSADCHRVLLLAACKLFRFPAGTDPGMQL